MPQAVPLWSSNVPFAKGTEPDDIPTLTAFIPENPSGASVVVCPGGGYQFLAPHEADPICQWLNTFGVAGFTLKYRLAPRYMHPAMITDARRAIRTVRSQSRDLGLDPDRIGILGFSAGGHLAATASTLFEEGNPEAADPIERFSSRPDLSILLYAVISLVANITHGGSRKNLLPGNDTEEMLKLLSAEQNITPHTPPAFIFHTVDDSAVPVENSMLYAAGLRKAGVPFAMHLFEHGRHGVGLAADDPVLGAWPSLCKAWLTARGWGRPGR